jgi:1-acyl-sn-glycerol-3-phosphate acyltransferase
MIDRVTPANLVVPAHYLRRHNPVTTCVGRLLMRLAGWRFAGQLPDVPKVLVAVAPHTSNWDFVVGVMALFAGAVWQVDAIDWRHSGGSR